MSRYEPESDRLQFLAERDGLEGAVEFAQRTLLQYRRAAREDNLRDWRRSFVHSCLAFRRFIRDNSLIS